MTKGFMVNLSKEDMFLEYNSRLEYSKTNTTEIQTT